MVLAPGVHALKSVSFFYGEDAEEGVHPGILSGGRGDHGGVPWNVLPRRAGRRLRKRVGRGADLIQAPELPHHEVVLHQVVVKEHKLDQPP